MSEYELFLKEYCGKCGKDCREVDMDALTRLDDGRIACRRYVCAVLTEGWR